MMKPTILKSAPACNPELGRPNASRVIASGLGPTTYAGVVPVHGGELVVELGRRRPHRHSIEEARDLLSVDGGAERTLVTRWPTMASAPASNDRSNGRSPDSGAVCPPSISAYSPCINHQLQRIYWRNSKTEVSEWH